MDEPVQTTVDSPTAPRAEDRRLVGATPPTGSFKHAYPVPQSVALVHDYLTQRGGAERVALSLTHAFPDAPLYASLYEPAGTFPAFAQVDVRASPLNRVGVLRRHHRLALPLLAPTFSFLRIEADVVVCSSSGWAHGVHASGRKLVYCHTPARWLYQPAQYLRERADVLKRSSAMLRPALLRWDQAAAASADRYLANSSAVASRTKELYGIEAEVLPPPPALTLEGPVDPVDGVEPGFLLCVSRLLPYKNVDAVVRAFQELPDERLVIVGSGPDERRLRTLAGANVSLLGQVADAELRWLYGASSALVAASYEDFGLTPLEAATFATPSVVLRWGGFLDTVDEGTTGVFFDEPQPEPIRQGIAELRATTWDEKAVRCHAARFSEERFVTRMREIVHDLTA
jgi:glycosyltransferase involved in cell wall biosynthesis